MRRINKIVLHCSATVEGRDHDIVEIGQWHRKRGMKKVGYHYVVKLDGTVQVGRAESEVGAHVQGHNADSIGICYVGGLGRDTKAKDTRTPKQKAALLRLLRELKQRYPSAVITGHRDLSKDLNKDGKITPNEWMKQCPCFDAPKEYKGL